VQTEVKRLHQLLNDYRAFYRREKYDFEPTSLSVLLRELIGLEGSNYETLGIVIENNLPEDLPQINVDVEKLKQVLLNLLKNASEAMPNGGRITLSARADSDQVVLEIKDSGVGIPAGVDIFEPFTTTKSMGTGLGLVIVRQILTAHGATISYSSEPGKETKFYLKFPAQLPALGKMA
jgi:signal transduction histidine kinase